MSFTTTTDGETDRGQVGIGTLIVFIAMVLVAAIAAGVLINTAGFLQTQAEDTGTEATDQVANNLNIITEVGEVSTNGADTIGSVQLGVQPAAGSDDVNLERVSVQWVSDESFGNLVHIKEATVEGEGTVFNTEAITAEDGLDNVMTDNADRYEVDIPLEEERPFFEDVVLDDNDDETPLYIDEEDEVTTDDEGDVRPARFDIVLNATEVLDDGGLEEVAEAYDGVEEDDIRNVSIDADSVEDIDAELFTNATHIDEDTEPRLNNSAYYATDPTELEDGADLDIGDLERIVVFVDEVDDTELEGFEEAPEEDDEIDRVENFDREYIENIDNSNLDELLEGEEAELTFTTESGAQTISILQVPDSLAGEDEGDSVDL